MKIKIGELAKMAACPVVTIRFYEREGLLQRPERNDSNYRLYDQKAVDRLRFILHCRRHGISLAEIRGLIDFREHPAKNCAFAHNMIADHIARVDEEIASLEALRKELRALYESAACKDGCGIVASLEAEDGCQFCQNARGKVGAK